MQDSQERALRVFVSSTFRDMVAERDRLSRFAFPALRRTCEERAVTFSSVDLRWGITDEEAADGAVLPICLAEIDASRPYFIGILGERYGWVPGQIPEGLLGVQPWLDGSRERSVTELEIVHGVLNNPEMAKRAFFYFRSSEASHRLGAAGEAESEAAAARLADLKSRIRASGVPFREGFSTPEALAELVVSDIRGALEQDYPLDAAPDGLLRERLIHDAFASELASRFVVRPSLERQLEEHLTTTNTLMITGEPGSGKSALLATAARSFAAAHANRTLVVHFCGASSQAAGWEELCHRLASELESASGVRAKLPDDGDDLRRQFKGHLFRVAKKQPYALFIDGLDQLEDRDAALELGFLPASLPANCRLVLSASEGTPPVLEAQRRGWPLLTVGALTMEERAAVLSALLANRAKKLDHVRTEKICAVASSDNPLFLSVLADELSVVSSHESLDEDLALYLAVGTPQELFERILARYERDYSARPGLVRDTMRAIWAARRGMSEAELLALLGDGRPLPQGQLSPLLLACGRQLMNRGGLMTFAHRLMQCAVERRYLDGEVGSRDAHAAVAEAFAIDPLSPRALDELPWQLERSGRLDQLYELLSDLEVVSALRTRSPYDARRAWAALRSNPDQSPRKAYREVVSSPESYDQEVWMVAAILSETGWSSDASYLYGYLAEKNAGRGPRVWGQRAQKEQMQSALGLQADCLRLLFKHDDALDLYRAQRQLCKKLKDTSGYLHACSGELRVFDEQGLTSTDDLLEAWNEVIRIQRRRADDDGLQEALGGLAGMHRKRRDWASALEAMQERERVSRASGNLLALQDALGEQAALFTAVGDAKSASRCQDEHVQICRELGLPYGDPVAAQRQLDQATGESGVDADLVQLEDRLTAARLRGKPSDVMSLLREISDVLAKAGRHDDALERQRELSETCREVFDLETWQASVSRQAELLTELGRADEALETLVRAGALWRDFGHRDRLLSVLSHKARLLRRIDRNGEAFEARREEEKLARELGKESIVHDSMIAQASILVALGRVDEGLSSFAGLERLYRASGNMRQLERTLSLHALWLEELSRPEQALILIGDAVQVARESGSSELADHVRIESRIRDRVNAADPMR